MAKIKYMSVSSTQELINLLKADLAKKQDIIQFTELPPPEQAVGRCYEYVGETTMQLTNGHIYHSDGFVWEEVYKGLDGKTNFNELDNIPTVNGIPLQNTAEPDEAKEVVIQSTVHKHDDDSAYDEDALIVDHDVPVHELELTALANAEIDQMFED